MKRQNIALARGLRHRMTDAERLLWRHLRGRHFQGWKFRRQHGLDAFIVDFVCLEAWLVVELDGGQHLEQSGQDAERTRILNCDGYRVMRFWDDDVLVRTDAVLEEILNALEQVPPHPGPLPGGEREKSAADAAHGIGQARSLAGVGEREKCAADSAQGTIGQPRSRVREKKKSEGAA
ncbi:MAG: endonuclease domain-containing protein [Rhodanobacteraceae bacterium]